MKRVKIILCKCIFKVYNCILNVRSSYQKYMMAECGSNVHIGPHGDFECSHIHIGNNVRIGAGCVVTKNVPDGATVVCAENRMIIKENNYEC